MQPAQATVYSDWQALYLFRKGGLVSESADTVPTAFQVLKEEAVDTGKLCPLLECHFSTLLPGAAIAPHCDLWNFSINLHLAIDIPEECGITVAGETRSWEEGGCLLFDYSFEHEAWNHSLAPEVRSSRISTHNSPGARLEESRVIQHLADPGTQHAFEPTFVGELPLHGRLSGHGDR